MFTPEEWATPLVAQKKQTCLGSNQEFIVYFEKQYRLRMALEFIVKDNGSQKAFIFIDNQAAIFFLKPSKQ